MELREKKLQEILQLAVYKVYRSAKKETSVYVPSRFIPPIRPYKWVQAETEYGTVKLFAFPSPQGGWVIKVRFLTGPTFNPAIPPKEGQKILKKLLS